MIEKYEFDWKEATVSLDGRPLAPDALDRAKYASFITNFLVNGASKSGYVINLNAPWGTGKTYFVQRWMLDIYQKHPFVYIDAWKQDYSDDPMLSVVASITEQLGSLLPKENQIMNEFGAHASRFLKAAAPAITKGLVKKFSGIDLDVLSDSKNDGEPDPGVFDGSASSDITKALVSDHNEKLKSVAHLKVVISQLVEAVKSLNTEYSYPIFIFVDELDRCRPTYAIKMLEVIKHFFNVENVIFVIATDTEQLQHSVKAVYGLGFDAERYLSRFFNRRFTLNQAKRSVFVREKSDHLPAMKTEDFRGFPSIYRNLDVSMIVSSVADAFNLSLRDTEQLLDKVQGVLANNYKGMNLYALTILFVLYERHNSLFWSILSHYNENLDNELNILDDSILSFKFYFYLCSSGQIEGIVPASEELCRFMEKYTTMEFSELITVFNKYLFLDLDERADLTKELKLNMLDCSDENKESKLSKYRYYSQVNMIRLLVSARDYINWIELAVSFDD